MVKGRKPFNGFWRLWRECKCQVSLLWLLITNRRWNCVWLSFMVRILQSYGVKGTLVNRFLVYLINFKGIVIIMIRVLFVSMPMVIVKEHFPVSSICISPLNLELRRRNCWKVCFSFWLLWVLKENYESFAHLWFKWMIILRKITFLEMMLVALFVRPFIIFSSWNFDVIWVVLRRIPPWLMLTRLYWMQQQE